jgi:hypothetical protein
MSRVLKLVLASVTFTFFCLISPAVKADTITFESDPRGRRFNGFQSVESNLVTFSTNASTLSGETLFITNFFSNFSRSSFGLATRSEQPSFSGDPRNTLVELILDFSVPVTSLSLDYGNDGFDDQQNAILTLFRNGIQVGQVVQPTNNNVFVDQTISFSFSSPDPLMFFDRATFRFDGPGLEVIDNVTFTAAGGNPAAIPEPTTMLLLVTGLSGVAVQIHRRRKLHKED